jgi:hypothetical protein
MGWVVNAYTPAALPPEKRRYQSYRRLCGPVWTGAENLIPTGIRSLYCPARIESLYRLSYPSPLCVCVRACVCTKNVATLRSCN